MRVLPDNGRPESGLFDSLVRLPENSRQLTRQNGMRD